MRRIDILIERAKKRAEAEKQQVGNAATGGDQTEYLIRGGLLHRCEGCKAVVSEAHRWRGMSLCSDCLHVASNADFQDTAPGYQVP